MTREEILAMKPGRELNMEVAKRVFNREVVCDSTMGDSERFVDDCGESVWSNLMPYSEDISTAEDVVGHMMKLGYNDAATWKDYGGGAYTPAEAICKRALLAAHGLNA